MNEPSLSILAEREEDSQGSERHIRWLAYLKWLGIRAEKSSGPDHEQREE